MSKLKNIHFDLYKIEDIKYSKYLYKDCTAKKKEFIQDKSKNNAIDIKNIAYVSLYYNQNPLIYITTPIMVCLFGMKNQLMSLQLGSFKAKFQPYLVPVSLILLVPIFPCKFLDSNG